LASTEETVQNERHGFEVFGTGDPQMDRAAAFDPFEAPAGGP
jgi:hypothetical protein